MTTNTVDKAPLKMAKRATGNADVLYYTVIPSPLKLIGLAASGRGLVGVTLQVADSTAFSRELQKNHHRPLANAPDFFTNIRNQLDLYFKGRLQSFDCPLDLSEGTPFQIRVWRKLTTIPYGKIRSYAWLAGAIDKPRAYRAVGNANGKNPIPIIVPCHRVIRENGDLGGYTGGTHIKRFLLDLETRHGTA